MSIRDELARIVAVSMAETNPSGIRAFDELSSHQRRQVLSRGRHAADSILARYAVVELPEPDSVAEPMDEYQGLAEWKTDLARIGEFDDGDGFIDMEPRGLMSISPSDMRDLAAALLAAANRAEAQS